MILSSFIIGISSSIDSLGIGITYGIKNTKISSLANIILFFISIFICTISMLFGNIIKEFLPGNLTNLLGGLLIIFLGFFMIKQSLKSNSNINIDTTISPINCEAETENEKIFSFFIKCFGITVQVIKNPNYSDFDNSKKIDSKEALFLGIALSLDSFGIVVGSAIAGIFNIFLPLFVSIFQIMFLKLGNVIGRKLSASHFFPDNAWSIISGILLIVIGCLKLF